METEKEKAARFLGGFIGGSFLCFVALLLFYGCCWLVLKIIGLVTQ